MSRIALRTRLWGYTGKVGRPQRKNFYGIFDSTEIADITGPGGVKWGKETESDVIKGVTNQNIG